MQRCSCKNNKASSNIALPQNRNMNKTNNKPTNQPIVNQSNYKNNRKKNL